jgi:hypothetical protein
VSGDISGAGYGSSHEWKHDLTDTFGGEKGTRYLCLHGDAVFVHLYDVVRSIFDAMRLAGVPARCVGSTAPHCCKIGCNQTAEVELVTSTGLPDDYTHSCMDHIGELCGTVTDRNWGEYTIEIRPLTSPPSTHTSDGSPTNVDGGEPS